MSKSQFNVDLVDMTDISDTSVERRDAELCAQFSWKGHPGTIVIVMEGDPSSVALKPSYI